MTKEQWMHMYQIVGAAQEVYNVLGRGMEEPIYQEAMEKELDIRGLKYQREVVLHTWYKGIQLNKVYQADFVCEDVVVEFIQNMFIMILILGAPLMIVCVVVGLMVSIFQTVTQIQEATLTYVPKIIAGVITLVILMPWMISITVSRVKEIFDSIHTII